MPVVRKRQVLSELEGAVMLEVHLRGRRTAFQVRKAFLDSPTSDWSGSAGAVYPAIKRLERAGHIFRTKTQDGRGTHELQVTSEGASALHAWATNPALASRLSSDPFRTRSDYLQALPKAERVAVFDDILGALTEALTQMDDLTSSEPSTKRAANRLAGELLARRKQWLKENLR